MKESDIRHKAGNYSIKNENSIDMLICVNGLPVVVLELKNPFTGQTYEDAIMQYKKDRSPNELLFQFKKRAIVFCSRYQEAYMTTTLRDKTSFLPFNKVVMRERESRQS